MELLTIILIFIIGILSFLLLKKERVLGINLEDNQKEVKIIENKDICTLCQERFFIPQYISIMPCGDKFHYACLQQYIYSRFRY